MNSSLTIIIPCYNEEESVRKFFPAVLQFAKENNFDLIVTNDGSTDKSSQLLNECKKQYNFTLIENKVNLGYGAALKSAINKSKTEYTISIDADGQHNIIDVENLYKYIRENNADLVIGSRVKDKSSGAYRKTGKWIIRKISKILVRTNVLDLNSGMKIYRTELLNRYKDLCPDSMSFSDIITLIFINQRHYVLEYPISINKRTGGKSTISANTAFETVIEVLNIVMLFNPLKIFLPVSIIVILLGIAWGIPIVLQGRGVSVGAALLVITGLITFLLGLVAEQLSLIRKNLNRP
jgi:glycosyltransferase involved in cell wall biosynthesis